MSANRRVMKRTHPEQIRVDTSLENCIFYISSMYEFFIQSGSFPTELAGSASRPTSALLGKQTLEAGVATRTRPPQDHRVGRFLPQGMNSPAHLLPLQALLEVGDDVVLVLDADRQPHHVRTGAGHDLLLVGELAVRGRGRMDDERAGVADIGEVREQPHIRDELYAGVVAALEPEGKDRARALRHVFFG